MPTIDNLDIQISTSLKSSNKQIDALIKKLNTVSSSLSKVGTSSSKVSNATSKISASTTKSTKSFKGLASAFGKFYASYFLVIRGIKGLYKSIESTADYLEAFNYFEVAFNKIGKDWKQDFAKYGKEVGANTAEEYAESFNKRAKESLSKLSGLKIEVGEDGKGILTESGMKNLGLNIQEITQYASQLASVTNSVGQTGEVSLAASNSFTKLAGDISSLFNQDYSAVAKNLQSGLIGQSRALYKYGIDITNATLQTYAYNMGIEKNVSEMTQAEKMQLRMIAILDQSKVSWGDLANTINSPSNMIRQFKNNLKEAGLVLGQLFIPLLQKVLPILNGITIAAKRAFVNLAGLLGIKLNLDEFGQSGADDMDDLSESLDEVAESSKDAKKGLRGFDELKTISSGSDSSGLANQLDLTEEILKATNEYENAWNEAYSQMENKAQNFADRIGQTFTEMWKRIGNSSIFDSSKNILTNLYETYSTVFSDIWNKVIVPFGENFSTYLVPVIKEYASEVVKTYEILYVEITEVFQDIWKDVSPDLEILSKVFEDIMVSISEAWNKHGTPIFGQIRETIENLGMLAKNVWETTLKPIWKTLTKNFDELWTKHLKPLTNSLLEFIGVFIETFLTFYNKFGVPIAKFVQDVFGPRIANSISTIIDVLFVMFGVIADISRTIISNLTAVMNFVTSVFTGNWKKALQSIGDIFKNQGNLILSYAEGIINLLITGINYFLGKFSIIGDTVNKVLGTEIKISKISEISIPRFEVGGYPNSASLFWANENGVPELVGTMGGKTAVASGTEITGIKDAIYSTGEQESGLMQTMVGLLKIIAEKEYGITDSDIGKSAQRYAKDYYNRTGNEAYSF